MPERTTGRSRDRGGVSGRLELVGLGEQAPPEISISLVDPAGKREPIALGDDGNFELDRSLVGKGYRLEIGGGGETTPRRYTFDQFAERLEDDRVYRIPEATWRDWILLRTCVTGSVEACFPLIPWPLAAATTQAATLRDLAPHSPELIPDLVLRPPHWPQRCRPVCQGKVEVFVRTCCCPPIGPIEPPVLIEDICKIIDCELVEWPQPPIPDPGPLRDQIDPRLERAIVRSLKRSTAVEGARSAEEVLRLGRHLVALRALTLPEQIKYIEAHADLRWWHCTCSSTKVAEVPLEADGHFDACFWLSPLLPVNCTRQVAYRVSQFQDDNWVVIYDGPARNEYFAPGEDAELHASWLAQTCDHPEFPEGTPFVILEQIGNTWADTLIHSTNQDGETSFAGPLGSLDGLANEAPAGPAPVTAGPYNQPWATTLNLRYQFHPGLEALGARYFRTRVARVGANGQPMPGGPSFTLTGNVSWRKYYPRPGGGVGVEWVSLTNPAVGGIDGLYTIPYPDLVYPWLGGQWHALVLTDELTASGPKMPNGRYVFVVDLFDAAGQRLVPTTSSEPAQPGDVAADFLHRRLDGPIDAAYSNTSVVPFNALSNLFWVDNLATYGDIEQIVHNGLPSSMNCQFIEGPSSDSLQLRYSAYQGTGFQWYHRIRFKQGLTGPTTWLPASNANVYTGDSPALSLSALLGSETKCAFAANLYVYARHTNGIGRVQAYDREDVASFALEITP
jgi:hypothetical protein